MHRTLLAQSTTWDFFVDGPTRDGVPPTVQFSNNLELRTASPKQIPPPPSVLN